MSDIAIDRSRALFGIPELRGDLIREALTVAGADPKFPDGFKKLAQLGTILIDACFLEIGYKSSLSRELISDVKTSYNTVKHRAIVAKKNGIQDLIEYGNNGKETENNLAFAISALFATVFFTRGSDGVRECVIKLGFLDGGPGLQMLHKYETMTQRSSGSRVANQRSATAAIVQSDTTINELDPPPLVPSISRTEASSAEKSRSHGTTPEASFTSETADYIPINLPRDFYDLDLGGCDMDHCDDNQGPTETFDTADYISLLNPEFPQAPYALECVNTAPSLSGLPTFSVQAVTPSGSTTRHEQVVEADSTMVLEEDPSPTTHASGRARKRKSPGDDGGRQNKRTNKGGESRWAIPFTRETERCRSNGMPIPSETFFRADIEAKCSAMELQFKELFISILFQTADASSFTCLRDAIFVSKTIELDKPRKISLQTSMNDRFSILERLDGVITYNALLKRYHLLELFRSCGGSENEGDMVVIPFTAESALHNSGRKGHPIRNAHSDVTQRMMRETFPLLSLGTKEYTSKRRTMTRYRALASRFQALVDKFGRAILCFIQPCDGSSESNCGISDNKIREISEASLKNLIDVLDQSQGDYLRSVCKAAEPLLQYLVYQDSSETAEFALEHVEAAYILQLPKGSKDLVCLLQEISGNGDNDDNCSLLEIY